MRKLGLTLLLAAMTTLMVVGCGEDDPKPTITRLYASETCGVAPMRVDFRADAAGGAPLDDPSGGNNWLKMTWDFGDGTGIADGTSVAYHSYPAPGEYIVTLTAEDNDGERASRDIMIDVRGDSLTINAFAMADDALVTTVSPCQPVDFQITAETCGFDPVNDSYERFVFRWFAVDAVYAVPFPTHRFAPADEGEQEVRLVLEDPTRSITRRASIPLTVLPNDGADVSLSADWLLSGGTAGADTIYRDVTEFPDEVTYTVRLRNDGPDDAFGLLVTGDLDDFIRLRLSTHVMSSGTFVYNLSEKQWVWDVPFVASGSEATLDVTVVNEASSMTTFDFPSVLTSYPCDTDYDDYEANLYINVRSLP